VRFPGLDCVRRMLRPLRPLALGVVLASAAACGGGTDAGPPAVTPTVTLNKTRASLGSPLELTYKFVVAPNTRFDRDYRVFVHFVNAEDEQMWTDDHDPPTPTRSWQPGQTIE
jgi:hypothetical protein